jgi:hypothetical protein
MGKIWDRNCATVRSLPEYGRDVVEMIDPDGWLTPCLGSRKSRHVHRASRTRELLVAGAGACGELSLHGARIALGVRQKMGTNLLRHWHGSSRS